MSKLKVLRVLAWTIILASCGQKDESARHSAKVSPQAATFGSLSFDRRQGDAGPALAASPIFAAQVKLDHLGFSPQVIDGKEGHSLRLALEGFQYANGLPVTGKLDNRNSNALSRSWDEPPSVLVAIPAAFAAGPFYRDLPHDLPAMARFDHLGYRSMIEALAERFHTTPETLTALNGRGTPVAAGRTVRVPNIANVNPADAAADPRGWNRTLQLLGVSRKQPNADEIVVDRSKGSLRVFGERGRLVAQFPMTTGSAHGPLPFGTRKIEGVVRNSNYQYNPDLFWDAGDNDRSMHLPAGPNGPVGVVWIDLSKPHYGIHGTPEPQNIGGTENHGCVRLTNWDAARLAQMVSTTTRVKFQP